MYLKIWQRERDVRNLSIRTILYVDIHLKKSLFEVCIKILKKTQNFKWQNFFLCEDPTYQDLKKTYLNIEIFHKLKHSFEIVLYPALLLPKLFLAYSF